MTLQPQNFMTHVVWNRSHRDDLAFTWFGRMQGKYKAKSSVKRMKKVVNGRHWINWTYACKPPFKWYHFIYSPYNPLFLI